MNIYYIRKKGLIYLIIFFFVLLLLFSLNLTKKTPSTFGILLNPQPLKIQATPDKIIEQKVEFKAAAPIEKKSGFIEQKTQDLIHLLAGRLNSIDSQNLDDLKINIDIANLLILKMPEDSMAYKAKLMSLLQAEGRFQYQINNDEVNYLLSELAQFDLDTESILKKEDALVEQANNEITAINQTLDDLEYQRQLIELNLESADTESPEYSNFMESRANILQKEDEALEKSALLQISVENRYFPDESYINEELVEIPFLRLLAKNEFNDAIFAAEIFMNENPKSSIGYFYLIKAYELSDQYAKALEIMQDERLTNEMRQKIEERLIKQRDGHSKKYWQLLKL